MRGTVFLAITWSAVLLAGCGGGGSGSDTGSQGISYDGPTAPVAVSPDNLDEVARVGINAASWLGSETEELFVLTGVASEPQRVQASFLHVLPRIWTRARAILGASGGSATAAGVTTVDGTEPCEDGGSMRVQGTVLDRGKLSVGDAVSITADDCRAGPLRLDGALSLEVKSASGDLWIGADWSVSAGIAAESLTLSIGDDTTVLHGDLTYTAWGSGDTVTKAGMQGQDVLLSVNGRVMKFLSLNAQIELVPGETIYGFDFQVADSVLGGSIQFETVSDFTIRDTADYPYQGVATATGEGGTMARLTANPDEATFLLEADFDGDGTYDVSETKNWAAYEL
ncbi:hypothetical protein [Inmirania thermothiophila]|uniref:Lipoprotein n=1 Tax=Inmirania thermothiophila TaxID=1750597 RepID=A0A3N1Y810_9GAMM|nr:hypothetical protein [Inmirania thermothiophila]ROR34953.1 hypothetical protein EDC57_0866 [Inmirania thermothiophila]